jgi:hypothetical protein
MAWLQNSTFMVIMLIVLVGLLVIYLVLRKRRKQKPPVEKTTDIPVEKTSIPDAAVQAEPGPQFKEASPEIRIDSGSSQSEEPPVGTEDRLDQIINPDINLLPDVILSPGEETVLLILPEHVPSEEVKRFEEFLRKIDALKIVTTGGSSDEGSNIGIRVLNRINLTELLTTSNMSIIKHLRKKGERIVISLKAQ